MMRVMTAPARLRSRSEPLRIPTLIGDGTVVTVRTARVAVLTESLAAEVVLDLVAIPGGTFFMGSPPGEGYEDERPRHRVSVRPFLIGRAPITQAQWRLLMHEERGRFVGDDLPVENVSREHATLFCERLAARTGRPYRLPSEAEWEYACRAGTTTPFAFGPTVTTDVANFCGEHTYGLERAGLYRHTTTVAGTFPPNAFGLLDMHGNLWEWCADTWHDDYAGAPADGAPWNADRRAALGVVRGGSWHDPPGLCRSAARLRTVTREGDDWIGLRVASDA
jgi:formylglycine-generating enzyme required for sulfatase activity